MSSSNKDFGAKRLTVGAHYGLMDWLAQRVTAVIMAVYTLVLLVMFFTSAEFSYDTWAGVFTASWGGFPIMKLLTFLTLLSLFYHAWIGIRDIWMDYVKPTAIRLTLHVLTILWLLGCSAYAALILWRL